MNKFAIAGLIVFVMAFTSDVRAQEIPELPQPQKEHKWLEQLTGEWETATECYVAPGQEPIKGTGKESSAMLGGFWFVARGEGEIMGMQVKSALTLGYDPEKQQYVGTWIDSMASHLWKYEGSVDETGKKLTLLTEGPSFSVPGQTAKYREVIEIKSKDERTFTSSVQGADGEWTKMVTVTFRRK